MLNKLLLRRRYIVDKQLQYSLIGRMLVYVAFTFVVMAAMLFYPLIREMRAAGQHGKAEDESVGALLYMHEHFWPVALICIVVAVVGVVLVSHRIAGPLVRVKRVMRFVQEGHFPQPLRTRTRDYFKPEVEILNAMVQSLSARIDTMQKVSRSARAALADLESHVGLHDDADARAVFDALEEQVHALDELLHEFTAQRLQDPERLPTPGCDQATKSEDSVLV